MLRNYITIAWRNLIRRKAYTAINISGLAIGLAAALLVFTIVRYELSYEDFQPNKDRIMQVVTESKYPDGVFYNPGIPYPALEALRNDIPQVISGALSASYGSQVTVLGNDANAATNEKKFIEETGYFFADPQFFQVFQYKWLAGSPAVLKEPNSTVLTQKQAIKYFGDWKTAVGQYLKLDNAITVKVNGILEDIPLNTGLPLAIVTSFETYKSNPDLYGYTTDWGSTTSNFQIFTLLPQNMTKAQLAQQLVTFSRKYYPKENSRSVRTNLLLPLNEAHFDTRFGTFGDHQISKSGIWTLALIGVFVILMACINFINLSTAQAVRRSKEVGVRKVLGSNRKQLFWQVIGETTLIVLVAMILSVIIAVVCMPYLKNVTSIEEKLSLFHLPTLLFLIVTGLVVILLSGTYPSLVLSRFNPSLALKNKITSATVGGISLRRALVVLQFSISQVLIIGTIVAVSQMSFVQHADLGFNKEALLVLNGNADSTVIASQPSFKSKLLGLPGVQSVSFSADVPSSDNNWGTNFAFDHKDDENYTLYLKYGDADYFKTYGLQLVAGRAYEKSDTTKEVVVNETLVHKLGVKDPKDIIGKEMRTGRSPWRTIVGVVKDFKTNSLREEIRPMMIAERHKSYSRTGIKLRTNNLQQLQASVQSAWNEFYPQYAYTSFFMDESINDFYKQEQQLSLLYKIFAAIAIFISCLGLYGLVSFMAAQRTKEVGVRKVLGASVFHILYLFSKEFTVLIVLAFLIAVPVAWYMMSSWLENFVFRIQLGWGIFAIAILGSIIIAWMTVGYRSVRAAFANPVKSLRSE
ncbi:MAG TPA: ABC transporter permease [Flavisolibacter sp.]|jgi:predicted permease|nr:ABC transporter permease [Flavisolibacter sp.]